MMFYTYLWLREDGTPYYVGKGSGKRAYTSGSHGVKKPRDNSRIFVQHWESEEKAFEMEKWWIAFYERKDLGTGCLRNLTDGGENPPRMPGNSHAKGKKHSAEANARKSERGKKRIQSKETRDKLSQLKKGKSNGLEGKPKSEETKRKISKSHLGMKPSEETRKKMSMSAKNRKSWKNLTI